MKARRLVAKPLRAVPVGPPRPDVPPTPAEPPALVSAVVSSNGTTLTLTFDDAITSGDPTLGFTLTGSTISAAVADGSTVTMTIAKVYAGDALTIAYNSATGDMAGAGGDVASFGATAVTNNAAAWTPAALAAADANRRVVWFVPGTFFEDSAKTTLAADTGDVVGAWDDAGDLWDVTQATTGNKPLLEADGAIRTGGSSQRHLRKESISPTFASAAPKTIAVRAKNVGGPPTANNAIFVTTSAGSFMERIGVTNGGDVTFRVRNGTVLTHGTQAPLNSKASLILCQKSDSAADAYVNGAKETVVVGTSTSIGERLYVGGTTASGLSIDIYAACAVIGGVALSDAEIARLDTFLDGY